MPRLLNFYNYFLIAFCGVSLFGILSRLYPPMIPWYWGLLLLFLAALMAVCSFHGRKAYVGILNTSESILLGILVVLFVGSILGGIASHV